ncbi:DUF1819 family protein [Candidatus Woesearchaeota archaeon]|nr:DUF1819 family protein [Candidatus Woesearchaeota archaeon]
MKTKYIEYNTNRTALIKETLTLLDLYVKYEDWKRVGKDVYELNVLMKNSKAMQDKIYSIIKKRYIGSESEFSITPFIKIANSKLPIEIKSQCMYFEFGSKDPLVLDIASGVLFERYKNGYNSVSKEHIEEFLKKQEKEHSELKSWAVTTRARFIRHYLSTIKEFGTLKGSLIKEFNKPYLPVESFLYMLHSISEKTNNNREILTAIEWHLFLMDADDVKVSLRDAGKQGYLSFEEKGNTVSINLQHKSLEEFTNAIIRT